MPTFMKKRSGNAVGCPPASALAAGMAIDDEVEVREEDGRILIERTRSQAVTLEWLLKGITPENVHPETDWGSPVGREIW